MKRFTAILLVAVLLLCGCGEKAEEAAAQTTVSGMVVSIDGTKVELLSTDMTGNRPNRGEGRGEGGPNRPEGNFTWPEGEMPTMPEGGFTRPEGAEGDYTMPEGFNGGNMPNFGGNGMPNFGGQRPEGAEGDYTMPEGFTWPEGEMPTMPEGGFTRPEGSGNGFNMEGMDTTTVDLKDAHISLELEDGSKAAGSMSDITVGSRLTITMEGDKAVRVVVTQSSMGNFGGFGGFGGNGGQGGRPNFGGDRGNRNSENAGNAT